MAPKGTKKRPATSALPDKDDVSDLKEEVPDKDEDEVPDKGEDEVPDKDAKKSRTDIQKQQTAMVNGLKNRAIARKATEAEKEEAKQALEVYNNLSGNTKQDFLARWNQTKSTKSLEWVKNFQESMVTTQKRNAQIKQKYMSRHMIAHESAH
jgi:hypothetical protein